MRVCVRVCVCVCVYGGKATLNDETTIGSATASSSDDNDNAVDDDDVTIYHTYKAGGYTNRPTCTTGTGSTGVKHTTPNIIHIMYMQL